MSDAIEKLKALRDRKQKMVNVWESEIHQLEETIREVNGQLMGINESIQELTGDDKPDTTTPPLISKYAHVGLTDAILDVLAVAGGPPGLFAQEIITKLLAEGFKSEAENPYASVYATGLRLVKQGKIREGQKDGKRVFMRNAA